MKVKYQTQDGQLSFDFEVTDAKAAFETLANLQEVFENECVLNIDGEVVKATKLQFAHRRNRGGEFYEIKSVGQDKTNGYRLDFCTTQDGVLFPRRRDSHGNVFDNNGWYKPDFKKSDNQEAEQVTENPF